MSLMVRYNAARATMIAVFILVAGLMAVHNGKASATASHASGGAHSGAHLRPQNDSIAKVRSIVHTCGFLQRITSTLSRRLMEPDARVDSRPCGVFPFSGPDGSRHKRKSVKRQRAYVKHILGLRSIVSHHGADDSAPLLTSIQQI